MYVYIQTSLLIFLHMDSTVDHFMIPNYLRWNHGSVLLFKGSKHFSVKVLSSSSQTQNSIWDYHGAFWRTTTKKKYFHFLGGEVSSHQIEQSIDSRLLKDRIGQFHLIHGRGCGLILLCGPLGGGRLIKSHILGPTGRFGFRRLVRIGIHQTKSNGPKNQVVHCS